MIRFDQSKDSLFVYYRKTDDILNIGDAKVDIIYTFYKGELSTILIKTNDSLCSRRVLKTFQEMYGKGYQEDKYLEKHIWYGRAVVLSYYENIMTYHANIFISSIKMKLKSEGRDKY